MFEITDRRLGDGVYASFDGYHIVLELRGEDSVTRITLRMSVLLSFLNFSDEVREGLKPDVSDL